MCACVPPPPSPGLLAVMLMCSGVCSLQGVGTLLLPRPPRITVAPEAAARWDRNWSPVCVVVVGGQGGQECVCQRLFYKGLVEGVELPLHTLPLIYASNLQATTSTGGVDTQAAEQKSVAPLQELISRL